MLILAATDTLIVDIFNGSVKPGADAMVVIFVVGSVVRVTFAPAAIVALISEPALTTDALRIDVFIKPAYDVVETTSVAPNTFAVMVPDAEIFENDASVAVI